MNEQLPQSKTGSLEEREKLRRIVYQRSLCGLANDTKWDEFITGMRARSDWRPSYRFKCIDGPPSRWDVEWFYHLPFPLLSVEWLDVLCFQEVRLPCLPPSVALIDHSTWIESLVRGAGLDYWKGKKMIRIFGYSPRNADLFDE